MNTDVQVSTILVVDDTPENLKLLENLLQAKGHRVLAFPNGRLALGAAKRKPPDLILLDVMMPEMDGFEVCEALKADETLKEIPVLFISALDEPSEKIKALAAGGVDYVTKPFNEEEVHARIDTQLELRRRRRELQEAYNQLRTLETLRDNLTHMVVHDMRSSLSVIMGGLELLREELPDDPDIYETHEMSEQATQDLTRMCNGLLDISRLEAGQMPVRAELIDLSTVLSEVLKSVKTRAQQASVAINNEVEPVEISADKDLLQRVLDNLLTNAIKYTPTGGSVTIRATRDASDVRIEVADTGQGISPEHNEKIFEKFGQLDVKEQGKRPKHSAGLGLTFCRLAVEAHGGTIGVDSTPGEGSVFWLILPTARD